MEKIPYRKGNERFLSILETFMKENGIERHLTFKQEMALMERIHKGDEEAFQELKKGTSILVIMCVRREYWKKCQVIGLRSPKLLEELLNAGYTGLLEGCKKPGGFLQAADFAELLEELMELEQLTISKEQKELITSAIGNSLRRCLDTVYEICNAKS